MTQPLELRFDHAPSAFAYMARACVPSPGFKTGVGVPHIGAQWLNATVPSRAVADFSRLTNLASDGTLPTLFLQTWTFRLQMAVLTHRSFPLPVWGALQIRNHLTQHRPVQTEASLDLRTRVAGSRVLDKGLEVDLVTTAHTGGELAWEGVTTFYYRGASKGRDTPSPLARVPEVGGEQVARWTVGAQSGWRFGRLTGDYNGVHLNNWYARLFGFKGAFFHPQRVVGQCLARLGALEQSSRVARGPAQRLDLWVRGPVYYASDLALHAHTEQEAWTFFLFVAGDERPAIVGRWSCASAVGAEPGSKA